MMRGGVLIVAIIARVFAGQQHVPGVMIVVVPLRAIMAVRRLFARIEQAGAVVVVLEHEMDHAAALAAKLSDRLAEVASGYAGSPGVTMACTASSRSPSKR